MASRLLLLFLAVGLGGCATSAATREEARNKDIVLAVFAAFETGDLATLERYFAVDGDIVIGLDGRKRGGPYTKFSDAAPFPGALTDVEVTVENIFAEGDYVAIQSVICGNHAAPILGVEPTGKRLCARYTNLYTLADGKIIANSVGVYRDQLLRQLESD